MYSFNQLDFQDGSCALPDSAAVLSAPKTTGLKSNIDAFVARLGPEFAAVHDPIRARRDRAVESLRRIGLLEAEQIDKVREDLEPALRLDEIAVVRVIDAKIIHPEIYAGEGSVSCVTRVIVGGYKTNENGVVDAIVAHFDNPGDNRYPISDDTKDTLNSMLRKNEPTQTMAAGIPSGLGLDADVYELLVADGRYRGMPVHDLCRPEGEPPVTGVGQPDEAPRGKVDYGLTS